MVGVPALIATHPFYVEQYRYFQHEADRQGAELVIVDSAPTKDVNEVQMLDDAYSLLESGVDAIIMEYINPEPFLDFQAEAASRGVCVLNESQTPLTGAQNWNEDNYQGGYAVGVHAGEWASGNGFDSPKMAVIVRPDKPTNPGPEQRVRGWCAKRRPRRRGGGRGSGDGSLRILPPPSPTWQPPTLTPRSGSLQRSTREWPDWRPWMNRA